MNYKIEELHKALLELLKEFDRVCCKFHIQYSIGFGTMLGAIRHKGFIPWDDDVDIIITRKEFESFVKVAEEELGDKFFLQTINTDAGYTYNTVRLRMNNTSMIYDKWISAGFHQGIYIDIIVLDNIPDKRIAAFLQKLQIILLSPFRFMRNKYIFFTCGKNIPVVIKVIMYKTLKILPLDKINRKELDIATRYADVPCKNIAFLGEGNLILKRWYPVRPIPKYAMKEFVYVPFEDTKLMCSRHYRLLLEQWYGNYMELPPEDQRKIYHEPRYFSNNVDYKAYLRDMEASVR